MKPESPTPSPSEKERRWAEFIKFCEELNFGEIEKLTIKKGLPVHAELVRESKKFE